MPGIGTVIWSERRREQVTAGGALINQALKTGAINVSDAGKLLSTLLDMV